MNDKESISAAIKIINDPAVQQRILAASKEAAFKELQSVPGFSLSREEFASLIASSLTDSGSDPGTRDAAEIIAAGAVFIAIPILFSDARLKHNIMFKDTTQMGLNVYEFSYHGLAGRWIGALAQEVKEVIPEAVVMHPTGYLMVDYGKIDVPFTAVKDFVED
jgi:hypothetical protein